MPRMPAGRRAAGPAPCCRAAGPAVGRVSCRSCSSAVGDWRAASPMPGSRYSHCTRTPSGNGRKPLRLLSLSGPSPGYSTGVDGWQPSRCRCGFRSLTSKSGIRLTSIGSCRPWRSWAVEALPDQVARPRHRVPEAVGRDRELDRHERLLVPVVEAQARFTRSAARSRRGSPDA